jgi:hypothetical protein
VVLTNENEGVVIAQTVGGGGGVDDDDDDHNVIWSRSVNFFKNYLIMACLGLKLL